MQGPVHEAFAAPIDTDLTDGVRVYPQAPPEPVDEQPPETQTEDNQMKWIPGYWAWDDDSDDYVWVSGLWRKIPPGHDWIPGYWSQAGSGYRWTSGYWTDDRIAAETPNYLPLPPKSIDNGPSVPPPGEDYFWVPGHWEYASNDYRWQSGFWSAQHDDWIWQPTCYLYTPQGYLLVDGYWDYLPSSRGQLYAPVHFYESVYRQPDYVYRPRYPLATTASLLVHLFFRPGYPHYYYGDFYGPGYRSVGFRPWYDVGFGVGHGYSSPWLGYYDWKYRKSGINFVGSMQRYENHIRTHPGPSSAKQFAGKPSISGSPLAGRSPGPKHKQFGHSLDEAVRSDFGRVAISRGPSKSKSYLSAGAGARNMTPPGFSRSAGGSSPAGSGRPSASNGFRSDLGNLNSSARRGSQSNPPSFGSPARIPDLSRGNSGRSIQPSRTPALNAGPKSPAGSLIPSPSLSGRSPQSFDRGSVPSFNRGSAPSFNRGSGPPFNRGSAPSINPGSVPSFNRGSAPSFNRGSAPSLSRGSTPSFNRGSAPSINRGSAPSFNRGSAPSLSRGSPSLSRGSIPSMKTNRGGGLGSSGQRGGGGSPKSGGSKSRGKGRK